MRIISIPLSTHTGTHARKHACMHACSIPNGRGYRHLSVCAACFLCPDPMKYLHKISYTYIPISLCKTSFPTYGSSLYCCRLLQEPTYIICRLLYDRQTTGGIMARTERRTLRAAMIHSYVYVRTSGVTGRLLQKNGLRPAVCTRYSSTHSSTTLYIYMPLLVLHLPGTRGYHRSSQGNVISASITEYVGILRDLQEQNRESLK